MLSLFAFPTKEVTRAEAAKIITYMMVGDSKFASGLKVEKAYFTDVPADHWAAGYIYYLHAAGVVNGCGNDTFLPDEKVTGLAFAKMLMGAVGYGVNGEYVGENWAIATAKDALQYGIFEGNLAGANNDAATREECALYAFNALFLDKVSYSELFGDYIKDGALDNAQSNKEATIAEDLGGVKKVDVCKLDAFKRVVEYGYKYVNGKGKAISGVYGDPSDVTLFTSTTSVTGNQLYKVLGKDQLDAIVDNGLAEEDIYWNTDKENLDTLWGTGNGIEVKVFEVDGHIWATIVNQYLGQIKKVTKETDTRNPKTKLTIDIGLGAEYFETLEDYGFQKGDYVFVTMTMDGEIQSVEAADSFVGQITKYTNKGNYLTINGEKYEVAAKTADDLDGLDLKWAIDYMNEQNVGDKRTFIVDKYGYIVAVSEIIVEPTDYVYVAKFGFERVAAGDRLNGDDYNLTCVYFDINAEEHIAIVNTKDWADWNEADLTTEKAMKAVVNELNDADNVDEKTKGIGLYAAVVKNGVITLTEPNKTYVNDYGIQRGITRYAANATESHYTDDDTIFFYVKGDYGKKNWDLKTYVGIDNVPVVDGKTIASAYVQQADYVDYEYNDNDKVMTMDAMSVRWTAVADDTTDNTVYMYTGAYDCDYVDGSWVNTYEVWVNGALSSVSAKYDTKAQATAAIEAAAEHAGLFAKFNNKVFSDLADVEKVAKVTYAQPVVIDNSDDSVKLGVDQNTLYVGDTGYFAKNAAICVAWTNDVRFDYVTLDDLLEMYESFDEVAVAVQYDATTMEAAYVYIYSVSMMGGEY